LPGSIVALLCVAAGLAGCSASIGGATTQVVTPAPPTAGAMNVASAMPALPAAGTANPPLPPGDAMAIARTQCLICHSSSMLLQQRLTERQWVAEIDKMQLWGARTGDVDTAALARYLAAIAGPDNDRFTPVVVAPLPAAAR
jgi:mono/diheme cytochrome c family protein